MPKSLKTIVDHPFLRRHAGAFVYRTTANTFLRKVLERFCTSIDDFFRLARASVFSPIQIGAEFTALLRLLSEKRPRNILEIGTANGGTLYLFTKVAADDATIVSVDLKIKNEELLPAFRRKHQRLILIEGDSTDRMVKQKLHEVFLDGVDLLFIDGDHSYDGVKADFQSYAPLVNSGGLIVIHDIVESHDSRHGVSSEGWTGGVPQFWKQAKQDGESTEFVESWQQDGFGIGVLFK